MLPGETIASGAEDECCGEILKLRVLESAAGYYIGTFCPNCGPNTRDSGYYGTKKEAKQALDTGDFGR